LRKKIIGKVILFLTLIPARLITNGGVNFLSMSASSELEPGPSWSGRQWSWKLVHGLGVQMMSREAQATAQAVGRGGFTGG
jgi:hypothetical protein